MIKVLSVENMRKSDANTIANKTPSLTLMKRAGEGVFSALKSWEGPVAIVCGSGNNAGDGYVIAQLLKESGIEVMLILGEERFSPDGRFYFDKCLEADISFAVYDKEKGLDFKPFKTIVDCIFGTGFHGLPKEPYKSIIDEINAAEAFVVSVDINSGLNGDSGMGECFVRSDITVSIGDYKPGHFLNMAKDAMKTKVNCDIGIEPIDESFYLLEDTDIKAVYPDRANFSNKGDYSYVALIGGSLEYSGAIRLATMAHLALRAGSGVVSVAVPRTIAYMVAEKSLEATVYPLSEEAGRVRFKEEEFKPLVDKYKVIAIGMGIGNYEESRKCVEYLVKNYTGILLIDADGLNALSKLKKEDIRASKAKLVLTPHIGEFLRLGGMTKEALYGDYINSLKSVAKDYRATILLKGPTTVISDGNLVYLVDRGCPGMATAGSGDVLSGITAGILGFNGENILLATAAAAFINGAAGELAEKEVGSHAMLARDTIKALSSV